MPTERLSWNLMVFDIVRVGGSNSKSIEDKQYIGDAMHIDFVHRDG